MKMRILELEKLISKYKISYYSGEPDVTDLLYDKLETELRELDPDNFELLKVGSITTRTGKIRHEKKMLSLGKTYLLDDLKEWMGSEEVISTNKIDGVSCSLVYTEGILQLAKTRGDGSFGEDITLKSRWVEGVPHQTDLGEKLNFEVRGELYCNEAQFFHLSDEMIKRGLDKPTSQRNIVAGLISRKDHIDLARFIQFKAFDFICDDYILSKEMDKFKALRDMNFSVPDVKLHEKFSSVAASVKETEIFMSEGDYQIDGVVFTYNALALHEELGETAHHPRYKMAFKFHGDAKETSIEEIIWSLSRNGILTPVAQVTPVELSGAMISRVTLHNYGLVKQHNLKKNDVIKIIRSGEVIPKFISLVKTSDDEFIIPTECPACHTQIIIDDIRLLCGNDKCPGKAKEVILNFIQKIGIDDLSSKRLDEMIKKCNIKNISDLYKIEKVDFLKLDKVKEKLAEKLYTSINLSKQTDVVTFFAALGLSGGAINRCEKIVTHGYDTVEKFRDITLDELMAIDGFAEKSATDLITSLKQKKPLVDELLLLGFSFIAPIEKVESDLTGKKVCITGSLTMKRSVIIDMVKSVGGVIVASVSKNTDYLLTNDTASSSSKFKKAVELKIPIINEDDLKKIVEG